MARNAEHDEAVQKLIAHRLNEKRKQMKLSMEALAERMGMGVASIHSLMTGDHTYPIATLAQLAEILDIPLTEVTRPVDRRAGRQTPLMEEVGRLFASTRAALQQIDKEAEKSPE